MSYVRTSHIKGIASVCTQLFVSFFFYSVSLSLSQNATSDKLKISDGETTVFDSFKDASSLDKCGVTSGLESSIVFKIICIIYVPWSIFYKLIMNLDRKVKMDVYILHPCTILQLNGIIMLPTCRGEAIHLLSPNFYCRYVYVRCLILFRDSD